MSSVRPLTGEREHRKPANGFLRNPLTPFPLTAPAVYAPFVTATHFSHEYNYILIPSSELSNMWVVLGDAPPNKTLSLLLHVTFE